MRIYRFKKLPPKGILRKISKGIYVETFCLDRIGIKEREMDGKKDWVAYLQFGEIYIVKSFDTEEEAKNWIESEFNIEIVEKEETVINKS